MLRVRLSAPGQSHLSLTCSLSSWPTFMEMYHIASYNLTKQEHWSYFEALYFCFIFFSTIGYGDFSPRSSAGRAFFIAWALFGIANMVSFQPKGGKEKRPGSTR